MCVCVYVRVCVCVRVRVLCLCVYLTRGLNHVPQTAYPLLQYLVELRETRLSVCAMEQTATCLANHLIAFLAEAIQGQLVCATELPVSSVNSWLD